ncbi:DUF1080 domain-containing protein [Mucilaginibacter gynuensis]|uniref:non-reducing end alpha-L-arabinofuranosidase n=1 Tax=Mucilaginibacter gynuensis TaxID=1302236 RepID=A0ABP8GEH5_9SPHI
MPPRNRLLKNIIYTIILIQPLVVFGQRAHIAVNAAQVLNNIPANLYGSCIEDVNHEIYGGLYDQRIFGESFEEPKPNPSFKNWTVYDGNWTQTNDGIKVNGGPGFKLVNNKPLTGDYTLQVQLKFIKTGLNAGLLLNVDKAGMGADNFYGYEVSIDARRQMLVLGKHLNNWIPVKEEKININGSDWTTLKVAVNGNKLSVYLNDAKEPALVYTDEKQPFPAGKIALRTFDAEVEYRSLMVTQGSKTEKLSFEAAPVPAVSSAWDGFNTTQSGSFSIDTEHAFNGSQSQVIVHEGGSGIIGVANSSLNRWGIALRKGQTFAGSIYLKAQNLQGPVTVALQSADGRKVYALQNIANISSTWKAYQFRLTSNTTDPKARFAFYIAKKGKLWADQITLMTTGKDQFKGLPLRADIAVKMQQQGLNFVRYGGTMVNAPGYRFKKMIGERSKRPPYKGHWYPYSTNGFGIEDFLQFCEAAGFEAAFAINIEETPQDAADMVEYLKGSINTTWGKKRAQNGHPQPYKVKYFEIGNEEVIFNGDNAAEYDHYIERFTILHKAMHAKDASIKFINSAWWRPGSANMERVFKALNGKADYWDLHTDADAPNSGLKVDSTLTNMQALFKKWVPDYKMKCAIFEENGGRHDLGRALGHATTLNAVRRHGDFVLTSCAANALQALGQNDNGWDQGQIFYTPSQVWGMPPFYSQQMAARNHQPLRISSDVDKGLDVTATLSSDGKTLVIHIVNPSNQTIQTDLQIAGFKNRKPTAKVSLLSGAVNAENTPEHPDLISTKTNDHIFNGDLIQHDLPANSYTILRFER